MTDAATNKQYAVCASPYLYVGNAPCYAIDSLGQFRLDPIADWLLGKGIVELAKLILECKAEMDDRGDTEQSLHKLAHDTYARLDEKYLCCHKGQETDMWKYEEPDDLTITHTVLHRVTGCVLGERGYSRKCMWAFNVAYEITTLPKEYRNHGRKRFQDWLRDTVYDVEAMESGYDIGPPCDANGALVPGECVLKDRRKCCPAQ